MRSIVSEVSSSSYKFLLYDSDKGEKRVIGHPMDDVLLSSVQDVKRLFSDLTGRLSELVREFSPDYLCFVTTWHGMFLMDRAHEILSPLYLWSDTGSLETVMEFSSIEGFADSFFDRTGCHMHPCYPFFKVKRYIDGKDDVLVADFGSYVNMMLTGRFVTGVSMASGTGFLDNSTCTYSHELLELAGINEDQLPEIIDEHCLLHLSEEGRRMLGTDMDILIQVSIPDGASNQIGALPLENDMTLSVGTSSALRVNVSDREKIRRDRGLFLYRSPVSRLLGAATNSGTNLIEWYRRTYGVSDTPYDELETSRMNDMIFLPFVYGERSPSWKGKRRYGFISEPDDIRDGYRSVEEGILFNIRQCYENILSVVSVNRILLSGGITNSRAFMQMCADILQKELYVFSFKDASLFGALYLLHLTLGITISDPELPRTVIYPDPVTAGHYMDKYLRYLAEYEV